MCLDFNLSQNCKQTQPDKTDHTTEKKKTAVLFTFLLNTITACLATSSITFLITTEQHGLVANVN